jgi:protein-disulfide isomerase
LITSGRLLQNNLIFFSSNMRNISKALAAVSFLALSTIIAVSATRAVAGDQVTPLVIAQAGPPITSSSGAAEIGLADHLSKTGAVMYGAYSCHYCQSQKQRFGSAAWPKINYVECAGNGATACNKAKIRVTPTWFIKGAYYPGELSLFKLAKVSGYNGATNFKNK